MTQYHPEQGVCMTHLKLEACYYVTLHSKW